MGELHDTVTALLDAFAHGISFIRSQGSRRKEQHLPVDPEVQTAETRVRKTLRKSRTDVNEAYKRDLAHYGPQFASGDAEAHSALSSIVKRLTSMLMLLIERFIKGRSTQVDYNTIMNLSNDSRLQAIQTFDQLSKRLHQSSLSLTPSNKSSQKHAHCSQKRRPKHPSSSKDTHSPCSKSDPSLLIPPTPDHSRPRHYSRKKKSPDSSKSSSTDSRKPHSTSERHHYSKPSRKLTDPSRAAPPPAQDARTSSRSGRRHTPRSFISDSTKLGEIPEHKWARDSNSLRVAYPLYSYPEPEKQRSRFMRFFGK